MWKGRAVVEFGVCGGEEMDEDGVKVVEVSVEDRALGRGEESRRE